MKIAVLGTRGIPDVLGGVETHCSELYPRLVTLGCDVTVFTRTPYIEKDMRLEDYKGVKLIHQWCPRKKSTEAIVHSLLCTLRSKKLAPDILHIHAIGPTLVAPMAKAFGFKIVMTHHGPDYNRQKWGKIAKAALRQGENFGVKNSDAIISISKGIRDHIKNKFNRDSILIPNGVCRNIKNSSSKNLSKYGLVPNKYMFTACRFVPEKGLHNLINAYRRIQHPTFKLVIAGDADHETMYSRDIKKMAEQTDGVVLTGFIYGDVLSELYSNAGHFVLPSHFEGLPIALLEAMTYGLPVLASDIPQHKEIPLEECRYFKCNNEDSLYEALSGCFQNSISEHEMETYERLIEEEYNWDKIALKTFEVYKEVCRKNI